MLIAVILLAFLCLAALVAAFVFFREWQQTRRSLQELLLEAEEAQNDKLGQGKVNGAEEQTADGGGNGGAAARAQNVEDIAAPEDLFADRGNEDGIDPHQHQGLGFARLRDELADALQLWRSAQSENEVAESAVLIEQGEGKDGSDAEQKEACELPQARRLPLESQKALPPVLDG